MSLWRVLLRIKLKDELLVINILTILLILIIAFLPLGLLRAILGLPVALFFPGYTLLAALFPNKDVLNTTERVALSFGLSMVVLAVIGLIHNYAPWGVRLYPILFSTALFIISSSAVAWFKRRGLSLEERFSVSFSFSLSKWVAASRLYKGLSVALILAILAAIGTLGYAITVTEVGERFTQFYILSTEGKIEGYPKELVVGQEATVRVGIVNWEREDMSYRIEVIIDGIVDREMGPLLLSHQEKWEREISFRPTRVGENQKVEFLLYRYGEDEPYWELHLWIDVKELH